MQLFYLCGAAIFLSLWGYLRIAQYNAHNHPIIDQPNNQLPRRTACMSGLPLPFWRAIHDGANITPINNIAHATYFIHNIISIPYILLYIKGGVLLPPLDSFGRIIDHILHCCPVLLQYESVDCISPYGLCATWNLF